MSIIHEHLKYVQRRFPTAVIEYNNSLGYMLKVPDFELPDGYNKKFTTLIIILGHVYPLSCPVDIYLDEDLRLSHGGAMSWTKVEYIAGHYMLKRLLRPTTWNPNRDTMYNYVMLCYHALKKCF